jgi:outer membrane protein assembly factor BamB
MNRAVTVFTNLAPNPTTLASLWGRAMPCRVCSLFALCFLAATLLPAADWPTFRGPNASGVAEGPAPTTWDATKNENILWKTAIPGLAHSSPVVSGNKVYVTTAISSDPKALFRHGLYGDVEPSEDVSKHIWKVYALDRNTGKILWEQVAHEGVPKTKRHPKSSQASSSPATDGKHVVAFFGSEGLYTYDVNGKLLWKQDLGILNAGWFYDPDYEWGMASSPIIYKNLVIVQCDIQKNSFIAAYDIDTGKQAWRTPRAEIPSWGTPTIYEGKRAELVTNSTKAIHGYDPLTGKELWTFNIKNSEVIATTPIVAKDLIIIANGYPPVQPIFAIKPGNNGEFTLKEGQEKSDQIAWSKTRGGPYMPTPLAAGDLLYLVSNNGVVTAYETATGERVYQQRLSPNQGTSLSASPVYADGKLYFPSEDGDIFVVKAGDKYELLATNPMGEVLMATPAISDGTIFIRGEHTLFAIRDKSK